MSAEALTLALVDSLAAGLPEGSRAEIETALQFASECYAGATLGTGELYLDHAVGMARACAVLNLDRDARLAALLFGVASLAEAELQTKKDWQEDIITRFGAPVAQLIDGLKRLNILRPLAHNQRGTSPEARLQAETLRKMLLAMVEDIRVVLLRLASRNQTLRFMTGHPGPVREQLAHESMEIYAPLANRLGVWQLKWEIEDLSFRFLEPDIYKRIAKMLDERRTEREQFIETTMVRLKAEMAVAGIQAEVQGRPKHIYSIWNKMRSKRLEFDEVYDVRALRILVPEIKDCYTALSVVHQRWQPVPGEFDDYIAQPKGNNYRSLHTAVIAEDGRPFEVQIRTYEMHYHSELGVAAHWRYKESGHSEESSAADHAYNDKISWLRQLLSWRDEIADSSEWIAHFKQAELNDTIYVLTPQGRVFDLARGATPLDFAYRLHTDLGHRCRGARVDGQLVALNTPLNNGQQVEIITARQGAPSRDWLNPAQAYLATSRARQKVRQWFAAQEDEALQSQGRALIARELQREGQSQFNLDTLASRLRFKSTEELYRAAGRGELGLRNLHRALHGEADELAHEAEAAPAIQLRHSRRQQASGVLVVGVDNLLTQLARCCRPVPPDEIAGFVTRGKGVSIHRRDCRTFEHLAGRNPERVIETAWGQHSVCGQNLYSVLIVVDALDRQGLLRDISEVFSRERVNVNAVKTSTRNAQARMSFTIELHGTAELQRLLNLVHDVPGVIDARRG
ncbi:MAG: bifunctional (p)ppGpp synthetase/guanosine-3',5'-bis(diphosphate) 3'-pyrophosphohydrolase [Sterolibacterium sp.]|nr:bifunctional (p)ppGpp synthetase/guanosine-3',5'-bis(diphosphate) 3'-pyrophosphohydrolase [Sterolibacterium sp.]